MSEVTAILGQRIRTYRLKKALSQEKLAELSELHTTYIGQLERGEKNPTILSLLKISAALEISIEKLLENMSEYQNNKSISTPYKAFEFFSSLDEKEAARLFDIVEKIYKYKQN